MQKKYSEIIGMFVADRENRRHVGTVKYIISDGSNGKVLAFVLSMFGRRIVLSQDVLKIGRYLEIPSASDVVDAEEIVRVNEVMRNKEPFLAKNTFTESGDYLGKVYDYSFDTTTFDIRQIYTKKAVMWFFATSRKIIDTRNIIDVKDDKIVVKDAFVKEAKLKFNGDLTPDFN